MSEYKIRKVLNSSVVLAGDSGGKEVIILGKGIGYGKKPGQIVLSAQISQVFLPKESNQLEKLLSEVSPEIIAVSAQIFKMIKSDLPDINDTLIYSLIDHIGFAIQRLEDGMMFKNYLYHDVKMYYPQEFKLGQRACEMINERFGIKLPDTEAASIAFHIADSRNTRSESYDSMKVSKITDEILRIIMIIAGKELIDLNSSNYHRLLTHVKFFAERLITGTQLEGKDRIMYEHVLDNYPNSTKIAIRLLEYLDKNYHYSVTSEELMYLIIHIHRNIHRNI